MIVDVACIVFGFVGVVFGVRSYVELWRWAKQCQRAQIAVAYKNKVKISAPLVEWLLWCNQLKGDKVNGQVMYQLGGTRIAILQGATPPSKVRQAFKIGTWRRKRAAVPSPVREGTWSATDQTVKADAVAGVTRNNRNGGT